MCIRDRCIDDQVQIFHGKGQMVQIIFPVLSKPGGLSEPSGPVSYTHLDVYKRQEGILLLADPRIRDLLDIKVYVEADADAVSYTHLDVYKRQSVLQP